MAGRTHGREPEWRASSELTLLLAAVAVAHTAAIDAIHGDLRQVGLHHFTESSVSELRRDVRALEHHIAWSQVLDLRWAIFGLGITVVGIFIDYWT